MAKLTEKGLVKKIAKGEKIDWYKVSKEIELSKEFILKYADKLDWRQHDFYYNNCTTIDKEVIKKNEKKIMFCYLFGYLNVVGCKYADPKLIEKYSNKYTENDWAEIVRHYYDEQFIEKHQDKLNDKAWAGIVYSFEDDFSRSFKKKFKKQIEAGESYLQWFNNSFNYSSF